MPVVLLLYKVRIVALKIPAYNHIQLNYAPGSTMTNSSLQPFLSLSANFAWISSESWRKNHSICLPFYMMYEWMLKASSLPSLQMSRIYFLTTLQNLPTSKPWHLILTEKLAFPLEIIQYSTVSLNLPSVLIILSVKYCHYTNYSPLYWSSDFNSPMGVLIHKI